MGNEDQALIEPTKKIRRDHSHPKKGKNSHRNQKDNPRRDLSSVRCYTCDEKGHSPEIVPEIKVAPQEEQQKKTSGSHCRG